MICAYGDVVLRELFKTHLHSVDKQCAMASPMALSHTFPVFSAVVAAADDAAVVPNSQNVRWRECLLCNYDDFLQQ